ncbi:hypothetical protein Taro_050585 [Colocasia esculenta]|uniref:Uncharacterized protein n=1 Tax=Colocasia esculenta TaxID=4460 RepID=A0A843XEC2_COLES|nr:hypothetical protein [Colocasia esculenta]
MPIAHRWDPRRDTRTLSDQLASLQEAIDYYPHLDISSVVEFPSRDRTPRPGRSFRGLHDTTDWQEQAKEQIQNWECRGNGVKSSATTDDAYLQAYALKYGRKVYKSARRQQREVERVRRAAVASASSSRAAEGPQSDLEVRLTAAVRRAEETQADLAERETELRAATD